MKAQKARYGERRIAPNLFHYHWIPTNGADMSGHDFGCEYAWLHVVGVGVSLVKVEQAKRHDCPWEIVTHYMPTDIRTPEPPE